MSTGERGTTQGRPSRAAKDRPGVFLPAVDWWRRYLGLSHAAFARRLGISPSYWQLLRTGKRPLTLRVVQRILADRRDLRYALSDDLASGVRSAKDPHRSLRLRRVS